MSVDDLLGFGMTKNEDNHFMPYSKKISLDPEPLDDDDDDNDELAIMEIGAYLGRNQYEFVLSLPDGSMLYLAIKSIEDLNNFEKFILEYEPAN